MPLTESQQLNVEFIRQEFGDDAANRMRSSLLVEPLPPRKFPDEVPRSRPVPGTAPRVLSPPDIERAGTSEREFNSLLGTAVTTRAANAHQNYTKDWGEAYEIGRREVADKISKSRDVHGREVPFASKKNIEEMGSLEAMFESVLPQVIKGQSYTEARAEAVAEGERQRAQKMAKIEAKYPNASPEDHRNELHRQLRERKGRFVELAEADYPHVIGEMFESREDVEALGQSMWMDWIRDIAPELYKEERPITRAAKDLAGEGFRRAMEESVGVSGGRHEPGTVVESVFVTGLRDLAGTFKLLTELPVIGIGALTWEVGPDGEPLDEEEWAYKKWMEQSEEYRQAPWIGGSGGIPGFPLPYQPTTRTNLDQDRPALESGDYWINVAYAVANGRYQGDELMDLPIFQGAWAELGYPNAPLAIGLIHELFIPVGLPLRAVSFAADIALSSAKVAERMASGTALANGASKGAQIAEAVADPMGQIRRLRAVRLAEEIQQGMPDSGTLDGAKDAAEVSHSLARFVADETVLPQVAVRVLRGGEKYVDPSELGSIARSTTVRNAVVKATDQSGRINRRALVGDLERQIGGLQNLAEQNKLSATVRRALSIGARASRAGEPVDGVSAMISRNMSGLSETMKGASAADIEAEAIAMVAKSSVRNDLLDMSPRLFGETMLVGNMVLTKKAWDSIGESVKNSVTATLEHTTSGSMHKFDQPQMLAEQLVTALGPKLVKESPFWKKTVEVLKNKGAIDDDAYLKVHREIQGKAIRDAAEDVVELQWSGRAATAAAEPSARRIQTLRTADEVLQHVAIEGLEAGKKLAPKVNWDGARSALAKYLPSRFDYDRARTPAPVADFMEETNAKLVNVVDDMKRESQARYGGYIGRGWTRERAAEQAVQDMLDDAVSSIDTNIKGDPSDTLKFLAWTDVARKFFGNAAGGLEDWQIKAAAGAKLDPATGEIVSMPALTPDNFRLFLGSIRQNDPILQKAGLKPNIAMRALSRAITSDGAQDNIFAAFSAFIAEQRANRMVREEVVGLLDANPGLKIQLHHPLEMAEEQTLAVIEEALKKFTPPRKTPGVVPGAPSPAVLAKTRTTILNKMISRYGDMATEAGDPRKYQGRREWFASVDASIRAGRPVTPLQLRAIDEALRSLKMTDEAELFKGAAVLAQRADEIAPIANNLMRRIASIMTSDARMSLARQALTRKMATGDIGALPHDVTQMPEAVGQLLKNDFLEGLLEDAGIAEDNLGAARRALKDTVWKTMAYDADVQIQNLLRSWGFTVGDRVTKVPPSLKMQVFDMAAGPDLAFLYGQDHAKLAINLKRAVVSGGLDDALEGMRYTGEEGGLMHVWRVAGDLAKGSRRSAISGMLGGVITPITRFHGLNAMTAPFIAGITSGWRGAQMAMGLDLKTNRLANWAAMRLGARPDDVLFTGDTGIKWTRGMVQRAIERNNVRFSQVSYEFHGAVISDIMREMRVNKQMASVTRKRSVLRWIDPTNKNFWNKLAEDTDNYWRQNMFVSALKEGKPELEAAKMAQNVLLDYGALHPKERQYFSVVALFYAFQRQMAHEVIKETLRGGDKLRQLYMLHRYQHEHAKTWAYSKDYEKTRIYAQMGPMFDRVAQSGIYGPGNPGLEAFNMVANVTGWAMSAGTEGWFERGMKGASEMMFTPEIRFLQEVIDYGPDSKAVGYVAPHHVVALMEAGVWPWVYDAFDLTMVQTERRRPGDPDFYGMQFAFKDKFEWNGYRLLIAAATRVGMMRTIDDLTKQAIAAGLAPEGAELKGLGTANPVLVAGNIQTPMKVSDEETVRYRQMLDMRRELLWLGRQEEP